MTSETQSLNLGASSAHGKCAVLVPGHFTPASSELVPYCRTVKIIIWSNRHFFGFLSPVFSFRFTVLHVSIFQQAQEH